MARNITRYGYGPNRSTDMPRRLGMTFPGRTPFRPSRTPAQQREAIEPLENGERIWNYLGQNTPGHGQVNPRSQLTPRQMRRMRRKSKMGGSAWARGERP